MPAIVERVESPQAFGALHALLVEYERDLAPDLRHGPEPALAQVKQQYVQPNAAFLALFDGTYGGCAVVVLRDNATAMLRHLYVTPHLRGQGAARALTLAAIDYARERRCTRMVLDTEARRLRAAYELYRSLGFVECEAYGEVDYRCPTFMALQL
jgi:GNAT superfamily N-acetyltransferase